MKQGGNMQKIVHVLLYGLLLAVVFTGMMGITHFIAEEEERVAQETERQLALQRAADKEAEEQKQLQLENTRTVLVKNLPVYQEKKIVKQKADSDRVTLSYGERMTLLEEDGLYAKIQTESGQTGYVWKDGIGKLQQTDHGLQNPNAPDTQPPFVVFIDVEEAVQQEQTSPQERDAQDTISLNTALKLEKKLESRGYVVIMARRSPENSLSDAKSAELASQIEADASIRICTDYLTDVSDNDAGNPADDSPDNQTNNGTGGTLQRAAAYCSTKQSAFPAARYAADSKKLGKYLLKSYTKETGFTNAGVLGTDEYPGIQKSKTPAIVLKTEPVSGPENAGRMERAKFQAKMADGIADGLDAYFRWKMEQTAAI